MRDIGKEVCMLIQLSRKNLCNVMDLSTYGQMLEMKEDVPAEILIGRQAIAKRGVRRMYKNRIG